MANIKFDKDEGVWRTIGGRRVFIRTGKSLPQAMKESGKFKKKTGQETSNSNPRDIVKYYLEKGEFNKADEYIKEYGLEDERDSFLENLNYKVRADYKKHNQEYRLYKRARENEDSIDPMTENSTDWEALDRKYKDRYEKENKYSKYYKTEKASTDEAYKKYVNEKLNDDNYLQTNRPNEYFRKMQKKAEGIKEKSPGQETMDLIKETNIKTFADEIKENKYSGYQQYLRDRYGTENEDVVSTGYKNKKDLYQEYKNEVIRNTNNKRMEKGTMSLKEAYKKAFEEYKKKHPNTKLNLQKFIDMNEE